MSEKKLSAFIGNIKRIYSKEDFNPFEAMDFVYERCLTMGHGSSVVLIGYSDRFAEHIIPAMHHVMSSRGILKKPPIPYPVADQIESHTGTLIKFANIRNDEHGKMIQELDRATIAVLCNQYPNATMKQIIRSKMPTMKIWDASKNNVEKG